MMTLDDIAVWLFVIAAVLSVVSAGLLVYCVALLLDVQEQIKTLKSPAIIRDDSEWPEWKSRK